MSYVEIIKKTKTVISKNFKFSKSKRTETFNKMNCSTS